MRLLLLGAVCVGTAAVIAGCGGGDGGGVESPTTSTTAAEETFTAPTWAAPILEEPGAEGAAVLATSDFAVGTNRISFLLVRANSSLIRARVADVYYKPRPGGPTARATARLLPIGVEESEAAVGEVREIYVAELRLPRPGKQWIVIEPRGVAFQGFQVLDVKEKATAIAIGERAPESANPTTRSRPAEQITTARPPDTALLRYSVAQSIRDGVPFVVAFATPAYCETRTCGPTVDVVEAARRRYERRGVRFIHVEIYEDNIVGKGVNRWVREWRLQTEPWVYVVDREGIVRDRFEGAVSVSELERSIRENLLP